VFQTETRVVADVSQLPAGQYGNWTKRSTQRRHQANEDKSGVETETSQALRAFCNCQSKKKHAANKRRDAHFLSTEANEKWIEDFVEKETAAGRKRAEDAAAAIRHEQEDTEAAANTGLTTRVGEKISHESMFAIRDSLSNIAWFN
jgi:hypothetical protein